jgi:hypothetical protein
MEVLAVVLAPQQIANPVEWSRFLHYLVHCNLPPEVRFTVIERQAFKHLDALVEAEPKLVQSVSPELDMPGALEEIADGAQGAGPGNDFRKLFVKLSNLAGKGDEEAANKAAVSALKIAEQEKWYDLEVAVFMVLGGLHLGRSDLNKAMNAYQQAEARADVAVENDHPLGKKLIVQTRFAQAAVLVGQENYAPAASIYEQVAPLTKELEDKFLELEAWRMAAYCHEMREDPAEAWRCGKEAMVVGESMDPEQRANSTLGYMGKRLVNMLAEFQEDKAYEYRVRERMITLIGEDWEQRLEMGQAAQ